MLEILFCMGIAAVITIFGVMDILQGIESKKALAGIIIGSFVLLFALAYYLEVPELLLRFVWNLA